jgi:hypothetical protein
MQGPSTIKGTAEAARDAESTTEDWICPDFRFGGRRPYHGFNTKRESPAPDSYGALLGEIKERIRSAQYAALRAVNLELLSLYWDIGRLIGERQQGETWGRAVVENLAKNLRAEFPASVASPLPTYGESISSTKPMRRTKNSHHRCEKLAGPRI